VIVHLAEATAIKAWAAEVPQGAWTLAEAFWPGPLTLILPRAPHVPDAVTGAAATVGLRVPAQPLARELLDAFGGGIAAPSANRFGRVSPTTAAHVRADLGADVDLVRDVGPCGVGLLAPRRVDDLPPGLEALPPAGGPQAYAQCLYQRLREADRRGLDVLLAVPPPETGIGAAVADRLRRAASTA